MKPDSAGQAGLPPLVTPVQRAHLLMYSHTESPCGQLLVCSTNFGHLLTFDLTSPPVSGRASAAGVIAASTDSGVYSLATVSGGEFLAAGCSGRVAGYRWAALKSSGRSCAAAWQLELSANCEANSLAALGGSGDGTNQLAVGCGDGTVRLFDLGHGGRLARCWSGEGRTPPVLRVAAAAGDTGRGLLAAADDSGAVRLLDPRQRAARCEFRPASAAPRFVGRPALGDWLACLACRPDSADWLACGGGPRLAVWHAANLSEPVVVASGVAPGGLIVGDSFAPMSAAFSRSGGDRLLAGGNAPVAMQFSTASGALASSADLSCGHVMSVGCLGGDVTNWRLFACGLGQCADVCSNLGYRLFSLTA